MPLVDMPLEQLKEYRGMSPRPDDFDAYWERALAELAATDPQLELRPAADFRHPAAECLDACFTGVGNARIHAKILRPADPAARKGPAIVQFHGYSGNAGAWFDKFAYVAAGFTVAALDCRGQGGSSQDLGGVSGNTLRGHIIRGLDDTPDKLLFRQIFLDCVELVRIVKGLDGVDPERIGICGGSQGGALTVACAALAPEVNRAAPMYPFLSDYRRVWRMDLAKGAYEELCTFFRLFDPTHRREDEIFHRLGYIDIQNLAPRIKAKVMMGTGLMDTTCPPSTQFAAYNKIAAEKSVVIYPDFGHELLPGFLDKTVEFMLEMLN